MSYSTLLIDTCTTQRYTDGAENAYGAPVKTWADNLTDTACRLQATTGTELTIGAEVVVADYKLFLGDVNITEQDWVVKDSITYEVLLVSNRQDGITSHHKECLLRVSR